MADKTYSCSWYPSDILNCNRVLADACPQNLGRPQVFRIFAKLRQKLDYQQNKSSKSYRLLGQYPKSQYPEITRHSKRFNKEIINLFDFRTINIKLYFFSIIIFVSIMEKLLLSATVVILSIVTIHSSNLILFGDFQNLIPTGDAFIQCPNICNQTWFAAVGPIELGNAVSAIYTISADLSNSINYQLCQNISWMTIGKTYMFTFDMMCTTQSENCSMWVIINNNVINGSNYTIYFDDFPHKVVGYFNSTLSNNTICFQSREAPVTPWYGTRLDNVTLQMFNGSVPCNVFGCGSCVLNFPNSCYACQTGFVKQPNQTCTMCSAMISNCAQCQLINNLYTCLQCGSQFLLNIQRNFCYHNSEISFKSEVSETAQINNDFIIKTNLSTDLLTQAGFSIQNLPQIMISINEEKQQNLAIKLNEEGFLEVKVNLGRQYQTFTINFQVQSGFIQINNTYFSIRTSIYKKPQVLLSEAQIALFQKYDELTKPVIQYLDAIFGTIRSSGFGFFIANIFNYLNLMTFYSYLNVYQPKTFRLFIESLSSQLNSYSLYKLFNLQTQVYEIAEYQVPEKIEASKQEWLGPLQAGFSTNFYKNNLQSFTIIAAFGVRLALCWILHKIFKANFLQSSSPLRFVSISSQFHTIIPIIILPSFNLIIKSIASKDYVEKINTCLHIAFFYICLVTPFLHLITQLQQVESKISKDRQKLQTQIKKSKQKGTNETLQIEVEPAQVESDKVINLQPQKEFNQRRKKLNQEEKNRQMQAKFKLVQRLKLQSVPIFIVFQQVLPFLLINICLLILGFVLSLKLRKYFSMYQFVLNTIVSLTWVLFHCCFCVFYIIERCFLDQGSLSTVVQILRYVSYSSIVIILFGALVQILDCLIGVINALKQIFTYLYDKCKQCIKITPQQKNNKQSTKITPQNKKNQQSVNIKPQNKKKQKQNQKQRKKKKNQNIRDNDIHKQKFSNIGANQKKMGTSKTNSKYFNRELFHFHQPQTWNITIGSSKFDVSKVITQKTNKKQSDPVNRELFNLYQHKTWNTSTEISKINNQTKTSRKIKKAKEQVNILNLRVKFINQD